MLFEPPFSGEDVAEVLAGIVAREPDWSALASRLDPRLRQLLERCLRKDRRKRQRDIGDARNELEEVPPTATSLKGES